MVVDMMIIWIKLAIRSMKDTLATPWTVALQAPLSMRFSRQVYWSGLPLPSQGIFLIQGWNLCLLYWQVDSLPHSHLGNPQKKHFPEEKSSRFNQIKLEAHELCCRFSFISVSFSLSYIKPHRPQCGWKVHLAFWELPLLTKGKQTLKHNKHNTGDSPGNRFPVTVLAWPQENDKEKLQFLKERDNTDYKLPLEQNRDQLTMRSYVRPDSSKCTAAQSQLNRSLPIGTLKTGSVSMSFWGPAAEEREL